MDDHIDDRIDLGKKLIQEQMGSKEQVDRFMAQRKSDLLRALQKDKANKTSIGSYRVYTGIAASVLIVLLISILVYEYAPGRELDNYLSEYYAIPNIERGTEKVNDWRKYYVDKDFGSVVEQLSYLKELSVEEQYFLGLSYTYQSNYSQAIEFLEQVEQSQLPFSEQAKWYAALCLLKTNNLEDAEKKLIEIIEKKSFKAKEAEKLLKDFYD